MVIDKSVFYSKFPLAPMGVLIPVSALPSDFLFYFIINKIAQFTKQYNYDILLSAYRPLTICKLEVQGLDQNTNEMFYQESVLYSLFFISKFQYI